MNDQVIMTPGKQKPMLTPDEYKRGRALLDSLPPGIYVKCSMCHKWQHGGEITMTGTGQVLCEECAT